MALRSSRSAVLFVHLSVSVSVSRACRAVNLFPKSISLWLNKQNVPTSLFVGKYLFMPDDDIDFRVVVGKTIKFPHIEQPSAEDIDKHHKLWIDAYIALFNRHKAKYAATSSAAKLEVY
jgi:hypothetical protein